MSDESIKKILIKHLNIVNIPNIIKNPKINCNIYTSFFDNLRLLSSKSSKSSVFFGLIIKEPNKIELTPRKLNAAEKRIQFLQ